MKRLITSLAVVSMVVCFAMGTASATVYFQDDFSYSDGAITNVSGGVWSQFSGASSVNVSNGYAIVAQDRTQDVAAQLGSVHSNDVIYAKFDFRFDVLPGGSNSTSYFFMFKDSGTSFFYARTFAATNNPWLFTPGTFRLGVNADSAGAPKTFAPVDLTLSNWYTAVIKVDQTVYSNGVVTVWIDPILESDPSGVVTGTVALGYNAISTVALRQATTEGRVNIDNLVVGSTFADVIPEPSTLLLVGVGLTGMLALRRRR